MSIVFSGLFHIQLLYTTAVIILVYAKKIIISLSLYSFEVISQFTGLNHRKNKKTEETKFSSSYKATKTIKTNKIIDKHGNSI